MSDDQFSHNDRIPKRMVLRKFSVAFSGLAVAVRSDSSFFVHTFVTIAVLAMAAGLRCEAWRWAVLILCIALVWTAELLNTSIECVVKKLHPEHDEQIGRSLDVAAAAVLVATIASVIVGIIVLGPPLLSAFGL